MCLWVITQNISTLVDNCTSTVQVLSFQFTEVHKKRASFTSSIVARETLDVNRWCFTNFNQQCDPGTALSGRPKLGSTLPRSSTHSMSHTKPSAPRHSTTTPKNRPNPVRQVGANDSPL